MASHSAGPGRTPKPEVEHRFRGASVADGRWIRVLTVVDPFTRACLVLHADNTLSGEKVAIALDKVIALRETPASSTVDHGTEFTRKALDLWAYRNGVPLDFIRPASPLRTDTSRVQRNAG